MVRKTASAEAAPHRRWLFGSSGDDSSGKTGRWRSALIVVCVAAAVAGGGWFGFQQLWSYVINLDEFQVYPGRIEVGQLPWFDGEAFRSDLLRRDAQRLLTRNGKLLTYSIFAPDLAGTVARAYEQSPWVRKTTLVRKAFPNRLQIQLDLRRPYAWLEYQGRPYILDREGVWLDPKIYRVPAGWTGRVPFRLAQVEQMPALGAAWRDPGVQLALDMARYIEENEALFSRLGLRCVEVRKEGLLNGRKRAYAVFATVAGTEIKWGCSPYDVAAAAGAEVSAGAKLRALRGILQQHGAQLSAFEYIDVRWDRPALKPKTPASTRA